jgi:hypothetical protein
VRVAPRPTRTATYAEFAWRLAGKGIRAAGMVHCVPLLDCYNCGRENVLFLAKLNETFITLLLQCGIVIAELYT